MVLTGRFRQADVSPAPVVLRLWGPTLGAVLVALASQSDGLYRFLVREDALLELLLDNLLVVR